jgi:hypothetical protein
MTKINGGEFVQVNERIILNPNAPASDKQVDQMINYLEKKGAELFPQRYISLVTEQSRRADFNRYAVNGKITKDSYVNQRVKELKASHYQDAMDKLGRFTGKPVKNANVAQASEMIKKAENKAGLRAEAEKEFFELLQKKDTIVKDGKVSLKEYLQK